MGSTRTLQALAAAAMLLASAWESASAQPQMLVPASQGGGSAPAPPDFSLFPFWQKVLADMEPRPAAPSLIFAVQILPAPAFGITPDLMQPILPISASVAAAQTPPCADQRHCIPSEWTSFLDTLKFKSPREQIEAVNGWANARPYVEDMTNWLLPDYWETPGEFIARGGDCEDFAVAKYFSLVRLGFRPEDMRIMVVQDMRENGFHAVLTVKLDDTMLVLDNFLPQVMAMDTLPYYKPVYALNEQGWQMHAMPTLQRTGVTITAAPLLFARH